MRALETDVDAATARDGYRFSAPAASARERTLFFWRRPQELILTLHGVGEPGPSIDEEERAVWIGLDWFEAILEAARESGATLAFDDGNSSDVEHALPMLEERGVKGHFFPLAGRLDMPGYLNADDIRRLRDAGMTIGSQGINHRPWRTLDDAELLDELATSRRALSEIVGAEVVEAACPFGSYDRRVLRALRDAGYTRVFNSDDGTCTAGSWLSARTTVHQGVPLESWVELARGGAVSRPGAVLLGKRLVKRYR